MCRLQKPANQFSASPAEKVTPQNWKISTRIDLGKPLELETAPLASLFISRGGFRLFTFFLAPFFALFLFFAPAYSAIIISVSWIVIRNRLRYWFGFRLRLRYSLKRGFSQRRWRDFEGIAQIWFAYVNFLAALCRLITENNVTIGIVGLIYLGEGNTLQAQQPEANQPTKQALDK